MSAAHAWAAYAADAPFAPFRFERRELGADDVAIDIAYCGICHSDVHFAKGDWGDPRYPCVPGHEIVGRVSAIGIGVIKFAVGDLVGVGCLVDSCGHCNSCNEQLEQYCENGLTGTYMGTEAQSGLPTYGGYSNMIVVREHFVLLVGHDERNLAATAPLLCAGITLWSPLRHWKAGPGKKVGIVGIGGLGHMGIKLARALGAHVVAFTRSDSKVDEALALGAHEVINTRAADQIASQINSFDLIINTVSASQDLELFAKLLRRDGTCVLVGAGTEPHRPPSAITLLSGRRAIAGSAIGGIAETQEMLDFCAANGITADIELIPVNQVDSAYTRILASDVKYRFVLDMATLPTA